MTDISIANYWHPVARADEVGEQPRQFTLLDEALSLFRDKKGVVAFKDLCIHRGTALSLGSVKDGILTCAYHGWKYDRSGACVHIPARGEGASVPRKARAIVYRTAEAYGLVWVALAEPAASLPPWPEDEINNPAYRTIMQEYVWSASAGRAVENFMDFSHFPFVHEGILGSPDRAEVLPYEVLGTDNGLQYGYGRHEYSPFTDSTGRIVREYYVHLPFTCHIKRTEPDGASTSILTLIASPIARHKTRLFVFEVRNHSLSDDEAHRAIIHTVQEQDRVIVESQRPEEIPVDLREELHIKVPDAAGVAYRRLLAGIAGVSESAL